MKIFQNFIYNIYIYEKLWGDDINSLIWIFIRTDQEMFSEKMWNFKMSYLPYFSSNFHPIFIIFSLICRKKCTLSFRIDSILEWISPLKVLRPFCRPKFWSCVNLIISKRMITKNFSGSEKVRNLLLVTQSYDTHYYCLMTVAIAIVTPNITSGLGPAAQYGVNALP